jgi:hypothetical protein
MMLKKRAIFIGLVLLLCADMHSYAATPVYFHDHTYKTLDELDQALAEGEVTYDEYLLLMESFLGSPYDDILTDETIRLESADTTAVVDGGKSRLRLSYHGSLLQKLEAEPAHVRYDRFACEWGKLRLDLSFEFRNQKQLLFRSRSLRYKHSRGEVIVGSYNLRLGQGVTQGLGSYHTQLHADNDFGSSLRLPIKSRHNGLLIRQRFGDIQTGVLLSDIEGADFYRTAFGSFVEVGQSKRSVGVIFLRQQLGSKGSANQHQEYLAPYFRLSAKTLALSGESSLGIGSSAAHVYQAEIERSRVRQNLTFFSYSRDYHNLQSGGYAYSDYEELSFDDIGFSYRDKRAGRLGLATSSTLEIIDDVDIGISLVRWNNRLDNRRCAAAKTSLTTDRVAGTRNKIIVRAIWENLDLTADSSSRRLVSLTTQSPISHTIEVESQWKFERRVRSGVSTSPFSIRSDLLWRIFRDLAATVTLKYYNPNLGGSANDYFHFAVGQKLTRLKTFSLWVKAQTKYLFDQQRLDVWEARVNCDFAM